MEYVKGIESQIEGARLSIKKIPAISAIQLFAVTGFAIIIIVTFISSVLKKKTIKYVTTPATIYDLIGKITSNVFTFIIFPGFVIFNVLINQWYLQGMRMYDGKILTLGYVLHSSTGSLYFIAGGLQFYTPLRQYYPKIHRKIGYFYYFMVVLTAIGIILVSTLPVFLKLTKKKVVVE